MSDTLDRNRRGVELSDMRIIVTGGTGLIGRALSQWLAARGDDVIILTRDPNRAPTIPGPVKLRRWDGSSSNGWSDLLVENTAIVNLAGEGIASGRWTEQRKKSIRDSRTNAGRAVVQAIEEASIKPRVVIQASAVGYYGPRGHETIAEDSPPGSDFLAGVCVEWENSTAKVETLGVRRATIRTGVVLSTGGGALPRLILPYRFFVGGPLGSGQQEFPWIHLADEVGAIVFLLDQAAASGAFNLAAPQPQTNAEFSRVLGDIMRRPARLPAPGIAIRLAFGELSTALLDGQRAVPRHLADLGFTFRFPDSRSALTDLLV